MSEKRVRVDTIIKVSQEPYSVFHSFVDVLCVVDFVRRLELADPGPLGCGGGDGWLGLWCACGHLRTREVLLVLALSDVYMRSGYLDVRME
jgi:hypothetical protein